MAMSDYEDNSYVDAPASYFRATLPSGGLDLTRL